MSDTMDTAPEDQIVTEMAALTHRVNHILSTWRTMHPTATRVPSSVRREINTLIKADAHQRKFAHEQERRRMTASLVEHRWRLLNDQQIRAWDTPESWFDRQRGLDAERQRIETSIYASAHLTAAERGQAETALARIGARPDKPLRPVFRPTRGLDTLRARARDGITRLRAGLALSPTEQRRLQQREQLHRERATHIRQEQSPFARASMPSLDLDEPIPMVPVDPEPHRTAATEPRPPHHQQQQEPERGQERERRYQATVGSAEILRTHPEMAQRAEFASVADGHRWVLDTLADEAHGWPDKADLVAEISEAGAEQPTYRATGPRGMVIDEVVGWQSEHPDTSLTEVEQLRAELEHARAENQQLRAENTELTTKFAHHDHSRQQSPATHGPAAAMPQPTRPIFHGPVITGPVMNGLDR